jgi:hypothetical protein
VKRLPKLHRIRVDPKYFASLVDGSRTFDIRIKRHNGHDFRQGDTAGFVEFDPDVNDETGRAEVRKIGYVATSARGLEEDFCIMSLLPVDPK